MALVCIIKKSLGRWVTQDDGATAIEYGLMAAGIALAISAAVWALGGNIVAMFADLSGYLSP
ncbi:MAG: Flp family type IVb pilin [Pseudobdellovibrionaceae bacterium]|jgi:pilus assembly protein Flp/PilA|nr:Flp family type IVb pilin [Pseudobdellovibrionaceae bacterium]